ncbi:sterol desaturase family protein [Dolichospermum circinale CS-1225]|uniref:sterol desaturase family protein n=1 Tax=Dolichospermum circinale TaxID=109265 RepID=UPI00232F6055|nr:sterol desaturase family protein [Dolichospermum circinale]MDB9523521.1 sterol desaturase family protein [Dolichospermum circinale CS-1225]
MQKLLTLLLNFCFEMEFYLKIAISCTIVQQVFYLLLHNLQLNLISQVLFYWLIGSISFYAIGFFIERFIKTKDNLTKKLTARVKKVKKQSLSIFFIPSDFHDLHHTSFKGNYGIQSFWDRVFKTLNPITKKPGIMFPISLIESKINKISDQVNTREEVANK